MSDRLSELQRRLGADEERVSQVLADLAQLAIALRQRRMSTWIGQELRGYAVDAPLPPQRGAVQGLVLVRTPQYGWILAPLADTQHRELAVMSLREPLARLEQTAASARKGGERYELADDIVAELQRRTGLSATLAFALPRDRLVDVIATTRAALLLWISALRELPPALQPGGVRIDDAVREAAASLDAPERYWRGAADLPRAGRDRPSGWLSRLFGT